MSFLVTLYCTFGIFLFRPFSHPIPVRPYIPFCTPVCTLTSPLVGDLPPPISLDVPPYLPSRSTAITTTVVSALHKLFTLVLSLSFVSTVFTRCSPFVIFMYLLMSSKDGRLYIYIGWSLYRTEKIQAFRLTVIRSVARDMDDQQRRLMGKSHARRALASQMWDKRRENAKCFSTFITSTAR